MKRISMFCLGFLVVIGCASNKSNLYSSFTPGGLEVEKTLFGWRIHNVANAKASAKRIVLDPCTGAIQIEDLLIDNDVRSAQEGNVGQIEARRNQLEQEGKNVIGFITALTDGTAKVVWGPRNENGAGVSAKAVMAAIASIMEDTTRTIEERKAIALALCDATPNCPKDWAAAYIDSLTKSATTKIATEKGLDVPE